MKCRVDVFYACFNISINSSILSNIFMLSPLHLVICSFMTLNLLAWARLLPFQSILQSSKPATYGPRYLLYTTVYTLQSGWLHNWSIIMNLSISRLIHSLREDKMFTYLPSLNLSLTPLKPLQPLIPIGLVFFHVLSKTWLTGLDRKTLIITIWRYYSF